MMQCLSSKLVHENNFIRIYDNLILQESEIKTYTTVERSDTVAIIAFNQFHKIIFQEVKRFPANSQSWEIPMGGIDGSENIIASAHREFNEETGLVLDKIESIGWFYPNPGLSSQRVNLLQAKCLVEDNFYLADKLKSQEGILQHALFSQSEVKKLIKCGHINDGFTLACLAFSSLLNA
jgi:ADP-ribose pyrophosphatase